MAQNTDGNCSLELTNAGAGRVSITGYVPVNSTWITCRRRTAVQLRTKSRGETSGALLDCLGYGLPTIINSHGSLAEVPDKVVSKLPDSFTDSHLAEALDHMYCDAGFAIS